MLSKIHFLASFVVCSTLACTGSVEDESMYLTGTEEYAITLPNGEKACDNPKKTLICHIPPGNPANAHTICVGNPAVAAAAAATPAMAAASRSSAEIVATRTHG